MYKNIVHQYLQMVCNVLQGMASSLNWRASKRKSATTPDHPALKKKQLSIENFRQPKTSGATLTCPPKELILAPEVKFKDKIKPNKGLNVYTQDEIDAMDVYEKQYRTFWNAKAQEILGNTSTRKALLGDVMAVRGAIDTSWALQKAELLKLDAVKVLKMAQESQDSLPGK